MRSAISHATLSGWGRYPLAASEVIAPDTLEAARIATTSGHGIVARGNGRAYGDAAVGARQTLDATGLNRMKAFDPATGQLTVEAGVLLSDIMQALGPRGFFPMVVPGTSLVTVGGAIAADIHGKNHHREGGFGQYVQSLVLATAGGEVLTLTRQQHPELFAATIGGMGLTGTILEATLQLRPMETNWIRQRTIVARDLSAAMQALEENNLATYSVAWIDCIARGATLGRSLVFLGEHVTRSELDAHCAFPAPARARWTVPLDFPAFALNHWTVAAFNELYFRHGERGSHAPFLTQAGPFFCPLDGVAQWNRIYGARGFVQHQCVLPTATAAPALADMLGRIAARGNASFLAVLKKLGSGSGLLSFAIPGYTLALDFPMAPGLIDFLHELDQLVIAAGGRLYLAKDACQLPHTFEAGYPNLETFRAIRRTLDPARRIRSRLSDRLGL